MLELNKENELNEILKKKIIPIKEVVIPSQKVTDLLSNMLIYAEDWKINGKYNIVEWLSNYTKKDLEEIYNELDEAVEWVNTFYD